MPQINTPRFDAAKLFPTINGHGHVAVDTETIDAFMTGADILSAEKREYDLASFYVRLTFMLALIADSLNANGHADLVGAIDDNDNWAAVCTAAGVKGRENARTYRRYVRTFYALSIDDRGAILAPHKGGFPSRKVLGDRLGFPEADKVADAIVRAYGMSTGRKASERTDADKAVIAAVRADSTGAATALVVALAAFQRASETENENENENKGTSLVPASTPA